MKNLSMKKKIGLVLLVLLIGGVLNEVLSQRMVENAAFNTMLKNLLSHSVPEKSVYEVQNMMKRTGVFLLDSREKNEYEVSHIQNSIWVGYDDFTVDRLSGVSKTDTIILYCSVGYRSEKIAEKLKAIGYKNVFNTYGGIFEWVNQNLAVVTVDNTVTNRLHAYSESWGVWVSNCEKIY